MSFFKKYQNASKPERQAFIAGITGQTLAQFQAKEDAEKPARRAANESARVLNAAHKKVKEICGTLADARKIKAQNVIEISFHKNWGHGTILAALKSSGFSVESGSFGNEYTVKIA